MIFENVQALKIPQDEVIKITYGNAVLWKRAGLPLEYQQVEYIQADGNQWIDTGVLASDYPEGIKYVFRGCVTEHLTTSAIYWFGALDYKNNSGGNRSGNIAVSTIMYVLIGGAGNYGISATKPKAGEDFELIFQGTPKVANDCTAFIDGTAFKSNGNSYTNSEMPNTQIYFLTAKGTSAATTANRKFCGKIYSFTMDKADGTPIRNFVPCYRKSDNVIGLYDTVGGTFYANNGSGSFTKGADV